MMPPRLSLAITTYERPEALEAVLRSSFAQQTAPFEILVADDGSGEPTRALLDRLRCEAPVPLRHLWQPHRGFRLTRLRNLAVAAAQGDYLVFVDGDMVLHPSFVADHCRLARRGWYTQGVRIALDPPATKRLLDLPSRQPRPWSSGLGLLRRLYGLHAPALQPVLRRAANGCIAIKGCNQGFWRDDLLAVNGFEEAIEGWGPEDKELCARLRHQGVRRQTLLCGGIAWHLAHPPAPRTRHAANQQLLQQTLATRRRRATRGVDAHFPQAETSQPS